MHRIKLLIRLSVLAAKGGARYFVAVLSSSYTANDSWLKAVYRDIVHISKMAPKLKAMENADLKEWTQAFAKYPKAWDDAFRAAYGDYLELTGIANLSEDDHAIMPDPHLVQVAFPCFHCNSAFKSQQKLSMHMYAKHQITHPIRMKVTENTCVFCMHNFFNRNRILQHLKQNKRCQKLYMTRVPDAAASVVLHLDECAVLERRQLVSRGLLSVHVGNERAHRIPGPLIKELSRARQRSG